MSAYTSCKLLGVEMSVQANATPKLTVQSTRIFVIVAPFVQRDRVVRFLRDIPVKQAAETHLRL